MKYANLKSAEGEDTLAKVFEAPAVRRIASGKLVVDDVLGMDQREIDAAFRLIRWFDSNGIPACPKCKAKQNYTHKTRPLWRCISCGSDYSITSGTVFSGAKLPLRNYMFALSLVLEPSQFRSIQEFTKELGLGYKSTFTTIQKLCIAGTEGKNGCTTPYAILQRLTWAALRASKKPERLIRARASELRYPFLRDNQTAPGTDLVRFVTSIVPHWLEADQREDVCQDILLAILTGEAKREEISANVKKYITQVMKQAPWKYKWISFDAPIGDGEGTLHDIISNERAAERYGF